MPVELDGARERAVVGERDGRHLELGGARDEVGDPARPVEDRVLGVHVQVDERGRHSRGDCSAASCWHPNWCQFRQRGAGDGAETDRLPGLTGTFSVPAAFTSIVRMIGARPRRTTRTLGTGHGGARRDRSVRGDTHPRPGRRRSPSSWFGAGLARSIRRAQNRKITR